MKKLMIIVVALGLTMCASAQRGGHGGWHGGGQVHVIRPRVSIGIGAYSPFYYSPFGYNPYGYPYGYNDYYRPNYRPSKLQVQVTDIKDDYSDKIWSAKHDTSLSRKERRNVVHQLKSERDKAINDAKRNYYKY
ncbi:MAG: hypothetical protein ABI813_01445 [Bacteroidota bacterium]